MTQSADCVVPDCPHCGEELVHAQRGHSADYVRLLAAWIAGYAPCPNHRDYTDADLEPERHSDG